MKSKDRLTAVLMLLPSLILLAVFVYGFIGQTFYTSLTNWGKDPLQALALNPVLEFIGLENYRQLFTAPSESRFRQDLVNTFFFTLFFLAGCLGLGLGLAVLLEQNVRGEAFFRTIFLFPMALAFIVTGTIWRWMLQPQGGVNVLPTALGLPTGDFSWLSSRVQVWQFNWQDLPFITGLLVSVVLILVTVAAFRNGRRTQGVVVGVVTLGLLAWTLTGARSTLILANPEMHGFNLAFIGIIMAAVWQMSGYTMALYLAGLRGIPDDLREAARSDGATEWQLYRHVILPLLAPITLSAMIILGHISLKIFDLIFAMAGADNATTDVPALLNVSTRVPGQPVCRGCGGIAIILLLLVALVIVPYLYTSLRGEVRR